MLNETPKKESRRPPLLMLAALLVALVFGGALAWLALSDGRLAGEPVARLALAPEPAMPAADKLLRTKTGDEEQAATPQAAPQATPPATADAPDKLTPDEQSLLDAAKRVHGEDADDGASDVGGEVKIVGAESVSGGDAAAAGAAAIKLRPVPDPALTAQGRQGILPVIAKDGRKAWKVYARPLPKGIAAGPRIALVVSGMGISENATNHAIEALPPEVTLSFAPYGAHLQGWITKARDAGHEVLLELPMEPFGYPQNDPGPYTMLSSLQPAENITRLEWLMSRFSGYAGVMNYQGARFTNSQAALAPILAALKARGLMYVDNGASQRSLAPKIAGETGLPIALGTRMIDPVQNPQVIDQSLTALEAAARQTGVAVGIATGFPVTVDGIASWAQTLKAKGITLVPVTATATISGDGTN
jgi:polysaccharide deacetylase 2 family uncharacterized protein YibQ